MGIRRSPVDSPNKGPMMRKGFSCHDVPRGLVVASDLCGFLGVLVLPGSFLIVPPGWVWMRKYFLHKIMEIMGYDYQWLIIPAQISDTLCLQRGPLDTAFTLVVSGEFECRQSGLWSCLQLADENLCFLYQTLCRRNVRFIEQQVGPGHNHDRILAWNQQNTPTLTHWGKK